MKTTKKPKPIRKPPVAPKKRPKGRPVGYRKPDKKVPFAVRLKPETVEAIKAASDISGMSQAEIIEFAISKIYHRRKDVSQK